MTDTPPVPPTPETPATPAAAAPAGAPAAGPKQTLSIVGFVLGIASIVLSGVSLLGLAAGIAGIIVSRRAKKNEPAAPSWMHTLGLVLSIIGLVLSVIFGILFIFATLLPLIIGASYGVTY
ncbi:MAG TPA: hypothetical protein VL294_12325 [Pseudolysinimonas sp.]|jgi:hypothetical protein|nr:hypothetical protein [Pseudolysinimonas sp.]